MLLQTLRASSSLIDDYALRRFLSPDGRCYTFDKRAEGYARGEGAACIVLKPLVDALKAGDTIRGVIRNTGSNQDGKTNGITLPSKSAQESLIRSVYDGAGLSYHATSYVEAHGTGTPAGDPIEAAAMSSVFGPGRPSDKPLLIGSVKTNIGHLEGASGLAGLIKTVLSLENSLIAPNCNFETANPRIPLEEWKLKVWLLSSIPSNPLTRLGSNQARAMEITVSSRFCQQFWIWWYQCTCHH